MTGAQARRRVSAAPRWGPKGSPVHIRPPRLQRAAIGGRRGGAQPEASPWVGVELAVAPRRIRLGLKVIAATVIRADRRARADEQSDGRRWLRALAGVASRSAGRRRRR